MLIFYVGLLRTHFDVYCFCRKRDVYQCGDLEKFIDTVTEKVEFLSAKTIADVLQGFLNQYVTKLTSLGRCMMAAFCLGTGVLRHGPHCMTIHTYVCTSICTSLTNCSMFQYVVEE